MATTKVTTDVIDMSGNAGGLTWVKGTTAQQPSGVIGEIREDTDTNRTLVYTDETGTAEWRNLKEAAVDNSISVDFLVVAGGAGGNVRNSGGGGAGGLRTSFANSSSLNGHNETSLSLQTSTNYSVSVGPGGGGTSSTISGNNGTNSVFDDKTSTGGGYGGSRSYYVASSGGSGGGGASDSNAARYTAAAAVTSPVTQGFAGGNGADGGNYQGGGGGGAAAVGTRPTGGAGLAVNILNATNAGTASIGEVSGTDVYYAGGGGGGANSSAGSGGIGGGSNGSTSWTLQNATPNTGGGAGSGAGVGTLSAGSGGSGVVILRYANSHTINVPAGLIQSTGSPFTEGTDLVSVFTSGSGTITFS